ncbi:hypothetical protein V6N13_015645 [Hibiscus sabdariffa]
MVTTLLDGTNTAEDMAAQALARTNASGAELLKSKANNTIRRQENLSLRNSGITASGSVPVSLEDLVTKGHYPFEVSDVSGITKLEETKELG